MVAFCLLKWHTYVFCLGIAVREKFEKVRLPEEVFNV
ncbi:hypothetical protein E9230_000363 [Corynebacterium glutamicum]|nr:hypothetical protein [Corynebacterium glutamicum]NII98827.1 hypothetical protein [Corynebacterium glutamicum]